MSNLSEEEKTEIRNRLDYIGERLHLERKEESQNSHWQDLYWSYNAIKKLLYKLYEENEMEE